MGMALPSEEVIWCPLGCPFHRNFLLHRWRVELQECVFEMLIDLHHGRLVPTPVAVVGRGEDCHHIPVVAPIVALHDKLMSACNELEAIGMIELLRNVLSEGVACTAWRNSPAASVVRIGPQKVTHRSFVWNFLYSVQLTDVVQGVQGRRDATVHADDLVLDDGCNRQVVKGVCEEFPNCGSSVSADAFIEEAVDLRNLATLVISTQQSDALLEANLVEEHERHCLHRVVAPIDIVTKEEVVGLWQWTSNPEELLQV
mmetsp:Transcript_96302/g.171084  ORF Transcript_96302/g.171084 Transcript_96302/m.171084 type:complete len:257 (+) Transcript_96302:63-833(+)